MSDFRSIPEELERVLRELQETRHTIQALSAKVVGMEKHLRRVFNVPATSPQGRGRRKTTTVPILDSGALLRRFDDIRTRYEADPSSAQDLLAGLSEVELRALAREVGVPDSRKRGLARLRKELALKIRESLMLGSSALRGSSRMATDADDSLHRTPNSP